MKKSLAIFTLMITSLIPLFPAQAQVAQEQSLWNTATQMANLENAKTQESIYGDLEIEETNVNFKVTYKIDVDSRMHGLDRSSMNNIVKAEVNIVNQSEASEDSLPFKNLTINASGEVINADQKDLYVKLIDLNFKLDGANEDLNNELEKAKVMINLVKGNWYHLGLETLYAKELSDLNSQVLMQEFKKDAKQGIKNLIEEMVTETVKQSQYYDEVFAADNVGTSATEAVDLEEADYTTYLTPEAKKNSLDLAALVEKGALECEGDTYKGEGLEDGFQYPGCFPSVSYQGILTAAEEALMNKLYASNGEWIYEAGKWYYPEIYGTSDFTDEDYVSEDEFTYDQKAIDEEVTKIMKGVDMLMERNFFYEHDLVSGPNQGFKFYSLNRATVMAAIKDFSQLMGEELTSYDQEEIQKELNQFSFGGIYHQLQDNNLLDHFFARFRYKNDDFLKKFELNYQFKLLDWKTENKIEIPANATELESLAERLML